MNDLHPRKAAVIAQPLDIIRDDAEILNDNVERSEFALNRIEEMYTGSLDPAPVDRSLRLAVHRPVGLKGTEMVNADNIDLLAQLLKAPFPPCVVFCCHRVPVVLRIPPQLPICCKVVGRNACHGTRRSVLIQVKELLMRPCIRAVLRNEDRHVAENFNALPACIVMQTVPLDMEDILLESIEFHLVPLPLSKRFQCLGIALLDLLRPLHPRRPSILLLCRMKKGVVVEPVCFLFAKGTIVRILRARPAKDAECLLEHIFLKLLHALKVNERRICLIRQKDIPLGQPTARREFLKINQHDIPCERRDGLIGRIAAANGAERQDLPDLLPRLREEVEETICLPAEVADAVLRRQRGWMQENARFALIAARLFALAQEEPEQRRNFDAQPSALDLIRARGFECILEHAAGKVAYICLDAQRLREAAVERGNEYAVFLLVVEHIVA